MNIMKLLNWFLVLIIALVNINFNEGATVYPGPPVIPKRLENPQEFEKYLAKLHNYYLVAGRPR